MKRTIDDVDSSNNDVNLQFVALGAGQEVGRSCHMLNFKKNKSVMLDCGIHPAKDGLGALPSFFNEYLDFADVKLCLITHFHLDHVAGLPYLMKKTDFNGQVYMTLATRAISRLMLTDFARRSSTSGKGDSEPLYTEKQVEECLRKVKVVEFHQEMNVDGIKFTAYHAGHVLGAAMFSVECDGIKTLYTGDYSRLDDRHLIPAEIPPFRPDLLIIESTCGAKLVGSQVRRETKLVKFVQTILERGGKCLLPVFSQGRAQEIMLILEEHWRRHPQLHNFPVVVIGQTATKSLHIFRTYTNQMNRQVRDARQPFEFRHLRFVDRIRLLDQSRPCVVLANPGFMNQGASRQLFESWCPDKKNGVAICGYSIQGTLAYELSMKKVDKVTSLRGDEISVKCAVQQISFMAHADFKDTDRFIEELKPKEVILVHGAPTEMTNLNRELTKKYRKQIRAGTFRCSMPRNLQAIEMSFPHSNSARVVGSEAKRIRVVEESLRTKKTYDLNAVVVSRDSSTKIMSPEDVSKFTDLNRAEVEQILHVPFHCTFESLCDALRQIFDNVVTEETNVVRVDGGVTIVLCPKRYAIEVKWVSSSMRDMLADSIVALAMELQMSHVRPSNEMNDDEKVNLIESVRTILEGMFGSDALSFHEKQNQYTAKISAGSSLIVTVENDRSCVLNMKKDDESDVKDYTDMLLQLRIKLERLCRVSFPLGLEQ